MIFWRRVTYRLYDKNHVKIESGSSIGGEEKNIDFTLKANTPYQLTFSRYRGNETISFPVKLTPIKVVKKTRTAKESGAIKVKNLSPEINGYIGLKTIIEPAHKGLVEGDISGSFKFSYEIQEVGVFSVSLNRRWRVISLISVIVVFKQLKKIMTLHLVTPLL